MKKSIAILGMGRFGQFLADELCANGADVLIADNDERIVNQYSGIVSEAIVTNLQDPEAIKNIGLGDMDLVIVSMGSSLEASIMCVSVAKELGVPRIIAKAASDRMGEILMRVGADEIDDGGLHGASAARDTASMMAHFMRLRKSSQPAS